MNAALIDNKANQIIGNEIHSFNKDYKNFYDVIIDIDSIKDITKAWKIKMNEKGKQNYMEKQGQKYIKICIIGNSNKGNSSFYRKYLRLFYHLEIVSEQKG